MNLDSIFNEDNPLTIGAEVEAVIIDKKTGYAVRDGDDRTYKLIDTMDTPLVSKDYYVHQIEFKTDPSENPLDCYNQLKKISVETNNVAKEMGLEIVPLSSTNRGEPVFCGTHVHVRYKNDNTSYYHQAWNALPSIYAIADFSKNCEDAEFCGSRRIALSRHLKFPHTNFENFWNGRGNLRHTDVSANLITEDEDGGKYKAVTTLETRVFDTPSMDDHLRFILEGTYNVFRHVSRKKVVDPINPITSSKLLSTRKNLGIQAFGFNSYWRQPNVSVVDALAKRYNFKVPDTMQFELRDAFNVPNEYKMIYMNKFSWCK